MNISLNGVIVTIAAFVGFVGDIEVQTQLQGYHTYPAHKIWQDEIANRFLANHDRVIISYRAPALTYDDGLLTIARQSIADKQPDFHIGGMQLLREFVSRKLVQPLDDLPDSVALEKAGYSKDILAQGQIGGRQYALPWGVSTPVVYVNVDLLRKVGGDPEKVSEDWSRLIEWAGKISKLAPDNIGMHWELGNDDWMTQNLLLNNGAPLLQTNEKDIGFDNARGLAALTLYNRFHKEGGQRPIEQQAARQIFFAGKMGFYVTTTAAVKSFETEINKRFEMRTMPLPLMSPDGQVASAGMVAMIVTKDVIKHKAALDFILFGTGADSQSFIVQNTGYMPSNTGALRVDLLGDFYRKHPNYYTSVRQLPRSRAWLGWPGENSTRIGRVIRDEMTALANAQKTPAQTLSDMSREVRELLPKP
jgi:multiple sugar transport system substrate-binding protein